MPSSNLAAYLAKNYLTASTANSSQTGEPPKKKRKKSKTQPSTSGLIIADDDEDLNLTTTSGQNGTTHDDDGDTPMLYDGNIGSAEFRKAKKSAWQALPTNTARQQDANNNDETDADRHLRNAQSDEARRLAEQAASDAPTVVNTLKGGLQTAADTARLIAAEAEEDRKTKPSKKSRSQRDASPLPEEETIYRDATGRRIDVSARRAQARAEAAEKVKAERQAKLDAMGEVQVREMQERKKELEDAKFLTLGRGVEDDEYNERLRGVRRWDDPMAQYLAEKEAEEEEMDVGGGKKKGRTKKDVIPTARPRKKEYTGPAPPNRYGIKPGWRWDGVDRGNGFEKEWFQARSKRSRNENLSYEWQMDE